MYNTDTETAEDHRQRAGKILRSLPEAYPEHTATLLAEAQVHAILAVSMDLAAIREGMIPTERIVDPRQEP